MGEGARTSDAQYCETYGHDPRRGDWVCKRCGARDEEPRTETATAEERCPWHQTRGVQCRMAKHDDLENCNFRPDEPPAVPRRPTAKTDLERARSIVRAEPGEDIVDAIIRWGHAVARGRCVCRFGEGGKVTDECEPHAKMREELERLRRESPTAEPAVRRAWGHAPHEDAEAWAGSFATREEAIEDGRKDYPGESFWIVEGTYPDPASFTPNADSIIDTMIDNASCEVGDVVDNWEPRDGAEKALDAALDAWAREWMPTNFYSADGQKERIEPLPDRTKNPMAAPCARVEEKHAHEGRADLPGSDARAAENDEASKDAQGTARREGRSGERTDEADVARLGAVTHSSRVDPVLRARIAALFDLPEWKAGSVGERIGIIERFVQKERA